MRRCLAGLRSFWRGAAPLERALTALLAGCLLATPALGVLWLRAQAAETPQRGPAAVSAALHTPAPPAATPSPFLPAANTRTPRVSPTPAPAWWLRLNLENEAEPLRLRLANGSGPLEIAFRPGHPCEFYDHRACISRHYGGRVVLATVHSGVGGEADPLRDALEGTGFNRAGLPLERIAANLRDLHGAPAALEQSATRVDGLRVLAAVRVPPDRLESYYRRPFDDALVEAAAGNPALRQALDGGAHLLAIETCGWRHPAEPWYPGVTDTSAAVYLVIIGL